MRSWRMLPLLFPVVLSACALIANLGERTLEVDGGEVDPPARTDSAPDDDGGTSPKDAASLPSFCEGITLYASFDGKLTGDRGGETVQRLGGVTQSTAGKFGGALSLIADPAALDQGAALYFVANDKGNPWPASVGSLAVWYRVAPGLSPAIPVLYRPVGSVPPAALITSGLTWYLRNDNGEAFGLHQRSGGAAAGLDQVLAFDVSAGTPYLRPSDYNHYFSAWRQGTAPTAFVALNGGLGVAENPPAPSTFPDAADLNGDLRVPFRGFTSQSWEPGAPPVGVRLGGLGTNSPEGLYDDLVIWNRIVSFDELGALYRAGKPVGQLCGIAVK